MRNNVRRLREDRLLSKAELARRAGVSPLTIDRVEYKSAAVSAQNGISRELTDLTADNWNLDATPWTDAPVTSARFPLTCSSMALP